MKEDTKDFFDVFLRGSGASGWELTAFGFGLLAIGILSNGIYDWLLTLDAVPIDAVKIIAAFAALMVVAYLMFWFGRRHRNRLGIDIDDSQLAPAKQGIIWALGPRIEPLPDALRHHRDREGCTHCWLIMQKDSDSIEKAFVQVKEFIIKMKWTNLNLQPFYIEALTAQNAYKAVNTIITREAQEAGLPASSVICDITGGIKPLTAGMMLAAMATNTQVEYVITSRDEKGQPIDGTQRVILVDTKFYLTRANTPAGQTIGT